MISLKTATSTLLILLGLSPAVHAQYANNQDEANKILNASLGSVGKCVVITVSSTGAKDHEYYVPFPNDKYAPKMDDSPMSLVEVTKRINEAIDLAKKQKKDSTITIKVETKIPKN